MTGGREKFVEGYRSNAASCCLEGRPESGYIWKLYKQELVKEAGDWRGGKKEGEKVGRWGVDKGSGYFFA